MIVNGKSVRRNFKRAEQIQARIDTIPQIPETAKVEVSKQVNRELSNIVIDNGGDISGSFGIQNNTLLTGANSREKRKDYYNTFEEMGECNFVYRGLQTIANDCSQKNIEGHVLRINSDDDDIKSILEELFLERLNVDKELWSIFMETCKLGDNFYEVIPDSYENPTMIARIRYLEPDRVNRIEKNGKLAFYTYTTNVVDPENEPFQLDDENESQQVIYKLEPWQIIHFRIPNKIFHPYGGSLLYAGVKPFRRLQLLEDGMVIYRIARTPERRVFKIDVGNLPTNEANRQVQNVMSNYRTSQILDSNGNISRNAAALSLTSDIFIPVREGAKGTEVTTLQAGTGNNNIDDLKFLRDEVLWTLNIPPEKLGFLSDQAGGGQGRGSLAMQDINFARFAERIQFFVEEGLNKLAAIELFFKKKKKDEIKNFKIELTPPSNIKEVMDVEFLSQKMNLIQAMISTGLFPRKFILKYVMKMSKKEIDNLVFFKDIESQAGQEQQNAMAGGMGMDMTGGMAGGDMNAGMGEVPPTEQTPPASSVSTEGFEDKIVRLFGKDVLIENQDEWFKISNAFHEYEETSKENKDNVIKEEEILENEYSTFVEILSEGVGNKKKKTSNESNISLIYENELGGLNFAERSVTCYGMPKKKSGPKKKNAILNYSYSESKIILG